MSRLRTALNRYVGMRQGLGYKYDGPARRLSEFVFSWRPAAPRPSRLIWQWSG